MGDVITFTPRPKLAESEAPDPQTRVDVRAILEEIGERVIALLDQMDGDADLEPDADAEPSLAAPEHNDGSQVGWCRRNDGDREAEAPEPTLPEVAIVSPVPKLRPVPTALLPWGGEGNVVAAAGAALLALVVGA